MALVLAAALGLAVLALAAGAAVELADPHAHLSHDAATVLATVLGTIAGALGAFLAGNRREKP